MLQDSTHPVLLTEIASEIFQVPCTRFAPVHMETVSASAYVAVTPPRPELTVISPKWATFWRLPKCTAMRSKRKLMLGAWTVGYPVTLAYAEGGRRMTTWKDGRSMGLSMYALDTLPSVWIGVCGYQLSSERCISAHKYA